MKYIKSLKESSNVPKNIGAKLYVEDPNLDQFTGFRQDSESLANCKQEIDDYLTDISDEFQTKFYIDSSAKINGYHRYRFIYCFEFDATHFEKFCEVFDDSIFDRIKDEYPDQIIFFKYSYRTKRIGVEETSFTMKSYSDCESMKDSMVKDLEKASAFKIHIKLF